MKLKYLPKNNLEKFGQKVYNLLVDNFSGSFYVGGMVRDILLGREVTDIDIATEARPNDVVELLKEQGINVDVSYIKFGVVVARRGNFVVEIASMRKEIYGRSRYPNITYTNSAKVDAVRRDFTVNSLYLQAKKDLILDYFNGIKDIKQGQIKFIGDPSHRIKEDPLRIVRALRFCLMFNFKLEAKTKQGIKNNFVLINSLTKTKVQKEIFKLKNKKNKNILIKVINSPSMLDKHFK